MVVWLYDVTILHLTFCHFNMDSKAEWSA